MSNAIVTVVDGRAQVRMSGPENVAAMLAAAQSAAASAAIDAALAEAAREDAEAATAGKLNKDASNADPFIAELLPVVRPETNAVSRSVSAKMAEINLSVRDFANPAAGARFSFAQGVAGERGRCITVPAGTYDLSYELGSLNSWEVDGPVTFTGAGAAKNLPGPVFQKGGVRNPDGTAPAANPFVFGPLGQSMAGITTFKTVTGRVSPLDVTTLICHSTFGHVGVTGMTRSLDNPNPGYDEGGIGLFGIAINDRTDPKKGMYAAYLDAIRMPGAGITHCLECDQINMGDVVDIHPGALFGVDVSTGLWVASGGGAEDATAATAAVTILANGAPWRKGIVHHELAYDTNIAQAFALYHESAWYSSAGDKLAWDRGDTARRFASSNTPTTYPAVNLVRARDSGAVASGDVIGGVNAITSLAGVETRRGGLIFKRGADSATEATLTGMNNGGYEFGLSVARNGQNSIDPTDPNLFALGAVNPWANIYSQNAVTVTSDARMKRDLGAPSEALLRAAAAVPIKVFQMLDAIATKGEDQARIHPGVIAQEVMAAFEAEGLDPWRYGILCADPWMETVETTETVEEPLFRTVTEEVVSYEIDASGGAVQVKRTETRQVEDWNVLPVFTPEGDPVWARKGADPYALILDETGRETALVGGESVRVRRVAVTDDMVVGENGVVRLVPARAAVQATHRVRATRFVERTVRVERPKLDEDGQPMQRLSVRYEGLILLKLAAMAAGIGPA